MIGAVDPCAFFLMKISIAFAAVSLASASEFASPIPEDINTANYGTQGTVESSELTLLTHANQERTKSQSQLRRTTFDSLPSDFFHRLVLHNFLPYKDIPALVGVDKAVRDAFYSWTAPQQLLAKRFGMTELTGLPFGVDLVKLFSALLEGPVSLRDSDKALDPIRILDGSGIVLGYSKFAEELVLAVFDHLDREEGGDIARSFQLSGPFANTPATVLLRKRGFDYFLKFRPHFTFTTLPFDRQTFPELPLFLEGLSEAKREEFLQLFTASNDGAWTKKRILLFLNYPEHFNVEMMSAMAARNDFWENLTLAVVENCKPWLDKWVYEMLTPFLDELISSRSLYRIVAEPDDDGNDFSFNRELRLKGAAACLLTGRLQLAAQLFPITVQPGGNFAKVIESCPEFWADLLITKPDVFRQSFATCPNFLSLDCSSLQRGLARIFTVVSVLATELLRLYPNCPEKIVDFTFRYFGDVDVQRIVDVILPEIRTRAPDLNLWNRAIAVNLDDDDSSQLDRALACLYTFDVSRERAFTCIEFEALLAHPNALWAVLKFFNERTETPLFREKLEAVSISSAFTSAPEASQATIQGYLI